MSSGGGSSIATMRRATAETISATIRFRRPMTDGASIISCAGDHKDFPQVADAVPQRGGLLEAQALGRGAHVRLQAGDLGLDLLGSAAGFLPFVPPDGPLPVVGLVNAAADP